MSLISKRFFTNFRIPHWVLRQKWSDESLLTGIFANILITEPQIARIVDKDALCVRLTALDTKSFLVRLLSRFFINLQIYGEQASLKGDECKFENKITFFY